MAQTVLLGLCALACPVGMWAMMRGMNKPTAPQATDQPTAHPAEDGSRSADIVAR